MHLQQDLTHAGQLMHVLMTVDKSRRRAVAGLERIQLRIEAITQRPDVEPCQQAAQNQAAQAVRRIDGAAESFGQIEMQADIDAVADGFA